MAFDSLAGDDSEVPSGEGTEGMRELFGPTAADNSIRQALQMCWMCLPAEKRNIDEVERQVRRLLDRALANAREDTAEFGTSESS